MANIADLRKEYTLKGLDLEELHLDPFLQFKQWFQEAEAANITEANAMSLATVDAAQQPTLRTVLLKGVDETGFIFFTNYESAKGLHIDNNPQVALLFPWLDLERQIKILGKAEKISVEASEEYFQSRPRGSQLGAWASPQSQVIDSREFLEKRVAEVNQRYQDSSIPLPGFWGGYRVIPDIIEFWQGRESRLHDRFQYSRIETKWKIERLAP